MPDFGTKGLTKLLEEVRNMSPEEYNNMSVQYEMEHIFDYAKKHNLWLHNSYYDIWFSPQELEKLQSEENRFKWGANNWQLKDANELVLSMEKKISDLQIEIESVKERIKKSRND